MNQDDVRVAAGSVHAEGRVVNAESVAAKLKCNQRIAQHYLEVLRRDYKVLDAAFVLRAPEVRTWRVTVGDEVVEVSADSRPAAELAAVRAAGVVVEVHAEDKVEAVDEEPKQRRARPPAPTKKPRTKAEKRETPPVRPKTTAPQGVE